MQNLRLRAACSQAVGLCKRLTAKGRRASWFPPLSWRPTSCTMPLPRGSSSATSTNTVLPLTYRMTSGGSPIRARLKPSPAVSSVRTLWSNAYLRLTLCGRCCRLFAGWFYRICAAILRVCFSHCHDAGRAPSTESPHRRAGSISQFARPLDAQCANAAAAAVQLAASYRKTGASSKKWANNFLIVTGIIPHILIPHPPSPSVQQVACLTLCLPLCARATAIFSGVECVVEKYRGRHDVGNGAAGGCLTGAALAGAGGPGAAFAGCAGFAAFSVAIDSFTGGH